MIQRPAVMAFAHSEYDFHACARTVENRNNANNINVKAIMSDPVHSFSHEDTTTRKRFANSTISPELISLRCLRWFSVNNFESQEKFVSSSR